MRLEDWQKFIESQFLEDAPIQPATSPAPSASPEPEPERIVHDIPMNAVKWENGANAVVKDKPVPVQMYPSFLNSPKIAEPETAPDESPASKSVRSPFVPVMLNDEEIPEFGAYLPSFAITEAVVETISETEPTPTTLAVDLDPSAQIPEPITPSPRNERRIPKSRARHLRTASTEETVKELSPLELWSGIPKYLETLLAMERTTDAEVAQYSYKSPFLEKRRELLQRLLDPELSLEETARLLCVCPTTVRRYTNRGILRCYRKEVAKGRSDSLVNYDTRQRRFRLTDILLFLETHCELLDKDRRQDAKTLYLPSNRASAASQESEL